ncbi:MAG: hypothetical protein AB1630_09435, partial [bacterium]
LYNISAFLRGNLKRLFLRKIFSYFPGRLDNIAFITSPRIANCMCLTSNEFIVAEGSPSSLKDLQKKESLEDAFLEITK